MAVYSIKSNSNILIKISLIRNLIDHGDPDYCMLNELTCDTTKAKEIRPIKGYNAEHKIQEIKPNNFSCD